MMLQRVLLGFLFAALTGCAGPQHGAQLAQRIEVAFSPEAGAEALVVKVIAGARQSIRLAGYSFTSPAVVRSLMEAKWRGVDVKIVIDDKGNRGQANLAAINLMVGADIPIRVISAYAIHHDKYIVVDAKTTETGSFNYSQAAAKSNSENVLVVWDNLVVAGRYLQQWESRWKQGIAVEGRS
jgi:phosphatidylserine/phosphatidylglycerophosphate/cardiolipin synthase-like enzyme